MVFIMFRYFTQSVDMLTILLARHDIPLFRFYERSMKVSVFAQIIFLEVFACIWKLVPFFCIFCNIWNYYIICFWFQIFRLPIQFGKLYISSALIFCVDKMYVTLLNQEYAEDRDRPQWCTHLLFWINEYDSIVASFSLGNIPERTVDYEI